jgi:alkanesulfonate monooxygenase
LSTPLAHPAPRIISTCPPVTDQGWSDYAQTVRTVARWSEENGCAGILIFADNRQADPWVLSQLILESTAQLAPCPAVQPAYMHPFAVANHLATFGHIWGRRFFLNMVAGGFRNDLLALGDPTSHDRRYERLVEYTHVVQGLLRGGEAVTLDGEFFSVRNLKLDFPLPENLQPETFISGSSEAGQAAARAIGATPVCYPEPPGEDAGPPPGVKTGAGIRVGIIARDDADEAWQVAYRRFPPSREGQLTRQLADRVSDSVWHKRLSAMARDRRIERSPYWLVPYQNYKTMCPYLVGSYDEVGDELARYIELGYETFILDVPPSEEELRHTHVAFQRTTRGAAV